PQVNRAQAAPQVEVSIAQVPFGQRLQVAGGVIGEDRVATVEQIDAAVELAGPRLGAAMRPLGHRAQHPVPAPKEREDLRSLRVLKLAKTDAPIASQRHGMDYRRTRPDQAMRRRCSN